MRTLYGSIAAGIKRIGPLADGKIGCCCGVPAIPDDCRMYPWNGGGSVYPNSFLPASVFVKGSTVGLPDAIVTKGGGSYAGGGWSIVSDDLAAPTLWTAAYSGQKFTNAHLIHYGGNSGLKIEDTFSNSYSVNGQPWQTYYIGECRRIFADAYGYAHLIYIEGPKPCSQWATYSPPGIPEWWIADDANCAVARKTDPQDGPVGTYTFECLPGDSFCGDGPGSGNVIYTVT